MPIDSVPDEPQASPTDAHWIGDDTRWYKPTWTETAKLLGWRWVYCLPLLLMATLLVLFPWLAFRIVLQFWKLWVFAIALPLTAFASAAKHAIRNRTDPFCIHCGYSLLGLPDGYRCPECGQPYLHQIIDEYRRDPDFFVDRCHAAKKLPDDNVPFAAGPGRRKSRDGT